MFPSAPRNGRRCILHCAVVAGARVGMPLLCCCASWRSDAARGIMRELRGASLHLARPRCILRGLVASCAASLHLARPRCILRGLVASCAATLTRASAAADDFDPQDARVEPGRRWRKLLRVCAAGHYRRAPQSTAEYSEYRRPPQSTADHRRPPQSTQSTADHRRVPDGLMVPLS